MITLESIKEAVALNDIVVLAPKALEYIKWLIEKLERQQQQVDIICDNEDREWLSKVEQVTKLEADLAKYKKLEAAARNVVNPDIETAGCWVTVNGQLGFKNEDWKDLIQALKELGESR